MKDGRLYWNEKGLRVNVEKTKGMQLLYGSQDYVSKVDLCGACGELVG